MRSAFLLFGLFLFNFQVFGQLPPFEYKWGAHESIVEFPDGLEVLMADDSGIYIAKMKNKLSADEKTMVQLPFVVERYDKKTLIKTDSLPLKFKEKEGKAVIECVIAYDGRIQVLYSVVNKKTNTIRLFSRQLDNATLRPESGNHLLYEIRAESNAPLYPGRFKFAFSENGSRIFAMRTFDLDSSQHEIISLAMLDKDLSLRWKTTATFPYVRGAMHIEKIKISEAGKVFVLGSLPIPHTTDQESFSLYDLFVVNEDGSAISTYPLQIKDGFLSSISIACAGDSSIVCAGLYSNTMGNGGRGVYQLDLSTRDLRPRRETLAPFEMKFILQDISKQDVASVRSRADADRYPELENYSVDDIIPGTDGSQIIIAEQRHHILIPESSRSRHASPGAGPYLTPARYAKSTMYNSATFTVPSNDKQIAFTPMNSSWTRHGDLVVIKMDAEGRIVWNNKIQKLLTYDAAHNVFSSYKWFETKDQIHIMFNDRRRDVNDAKLEDLKDFNWSKSVLTIVSITAEGKVEKQWIFDSVYSPVPIIPSMCVQVSPVELVLYGHTFAKQQFCRVLFR